MFGKNKIAPERHDASTLLVQGSPWATIQGEGPYAGEACVFLRLAGCNLRCYFCDTDFESQALEYSPMEVAEDIEFVRREQTPGSDLLVVTGGEPLLQNIPALICALDAASPRIRRIQIETAGSVFPEALEEYMGSRILADQKRRAYVSLVVSPKTPEIHPRVRAWAMAWKYIVGEDNLADDDGLPVMTTQGIRTEKPLARPRISPALIYVQPMHIPDDEEANKHHIKMCIATAMQHGYRISLQQHIYLGVD